MTLARAMQRIVLMPNFAPMIANASNRRNTLATAYRNDTFRRPPVAYWMTVQRPVRPPLDMLFGTMKHSQDAQYSSRPNSISRYSPATRHPFFCEAAIT